MGLKFKTGAMCLRLELEHRLLHEIDSSSVSGEITIGRDASCTWRIPSTDRAASNVHAAIYRKRNTLFIRDAGSRNGIYFNGAKIKMRKLSPGDQIGVGDCKLLVEASVENSTGASYHCNRIEQLNGLRKGVLYNLDRENIKIGSSANCDIVFEDTVISNFHACLEQKADGSTWIKDMGSRNGTLVNGTKLSGDLNDSGRMLRDGDIITISYIEMRFWDQYTPHVRSHLWQKIAAVVLSAGVILGGYFAWQAVTPSSKSHIEQARRCAADQKFDRARWHLEQAANAKGADLHKIERAELASQIKQWEDTIAKWDEVQALIADQKWISANKILSPMLSSNMELWRWNDSDANTAKNTALHVKRVTDAFLTGRAVLEDRDSTLPQMRLAQQHIETESATPLSGKLAILQDAADDIRNELDTTAGELEAVDRALVPLAATHDMESAIAALERLQEQSRERVALRRKNGQRYSTKVETACQDLLTPLRKLGAAKKVLDANYAETAAFRFDAVIPALPLPAADECGISPVLTDQRAVLETLNRQLLDNARQLNTITGALRSARLTPGEKPACLAALFDGSVMEHVFSCDSLDLPAPKWNRDAASGDYDRMLGIEVFYGFLKALPEEFDSSLLDDCSFTPDVFAARQAYSYLETYLKFIERETMSMVRNSKTADNRVLELALYADNLLEERDGFLGKLVRRANAPDDRDAVIAGGIALLLKGNSTGVPASLAQSTADRLKQIRNSVAAMAREEATPEQLIANRKLLLDAGIPGDPLIKQAWVENGESQ